MTLNYRVLLVLLLSMVLFWVMSPCLSSADSYLYAEISKELLESGQWAFLYHLSADWLDKPHFPFWVTALTFKLLGASPQSYLFVGFIFYCVSSVYTFLLARKLFNDQIALLSTTVYLSVLRVVLVTIDLRAECFLLGLIIPAVYHWLKYDRDKSIVNHNLFLGSIFSACAIMTKGLFVIVPIFSGMLILWIHNKQYLRCLSRKWISAYLLICILLSPEIFSLYCQFDLHPEKLVFNKHGISGVKWFFWGSQFGRFFNNGEITKGGGNYFFFLHTFLWSFLPWTFICLIAWQNSLRKHFNSSVLFVTASFAIPFIMFSLSRFQLDFYIVILFPFASMIIGYYLYNMRDNQKILDALLRLQVFVAIGLLMVLGLFISYLEDGYSILLIQWLLSIILIYVIWNVAYYLILDKISKIVLVNVLALFIVFNGAMVINNVVYSKYNIGYQVNKIIVDRDLSSLGIAVYHIDPILIDQILVHNPKMNVKRVNNFLELQDEYQQFLLARGKINAYKKSSLKYNILIINNDQADISEVNEMFPNAELLDQLTFIYWEHFFDVVLHMKHIPKNINVYLI